MERAQGKVAFVTGAARPGQPGASAPEDVMRPGDCPGDSSTLVEQRKDAKR
jgi:hypothetical protein